MDNEVLKADRLLEVAANLFRKRGYAGTTTRQLAAELGIKNASLYHYLDKKEDLLYTLCVDSLNVAIEGVQAVLAVEMDPLERLRAAIRVHTVTIAATRDRQATLLVEMRRLSPERYAKVVELRNQYEGLIRRVVEDGQAGGLFRSDISARMGTRVLLSIMNWLAFWVNPGGELTPEQLGDTIATLFFEGMAVKAQTPTGCVTAKH